MIIWRLYVIMKGDKYKHMKSIIIFIFSFLSLTQSAFAQTSGELIIFVQDGKSISNNMTIQDLPTIQVMAKKQNIEVKIAKIEAGAPEEIYFTPTIVFQNHLGRTVYRGRYKALDRLTNFIRTAQWEPQQSTNYSKENILYLQKGRTVLASLIKVTDLSGDLPKGFNVSSFKEKAKASIISGMSEFEFKSNAILPDQARLFYFDFYPYRNNRKELFISTRIYSMFSCVKPVFESDIPLEGSFEDLEFLFAQAGKSLEKVVLNHLNDIEFGDGIEPLNENIKTLSFEELGFPLPKPIAKIKNTTAISDTIFLFKKWVFEKGVSDNKPVLQFQFPAPLDHYSGEAKKMNMRLALSKENTLKNATGIVEVASKSITMGDTALDNHILSEYILSDKFPISSYNFEIVDAPENLKAGEIHPIKFQGIFQMKDIKVDLPAKGMVELIRDEQGKPRLHISAQFDLRLMELFGIKGPDGPKNASELLKFRLDFLMRPVDTFPKADTFQKSAQNYIIKNQQPEVEAVPVNDIGTINWQASTKLYKAKGHFKDWYFTKLNVPERDLEKLELTFEIKLASIWQKSKLLVKHVKSDKFFDVENHPIARIKIEGSKRQTDGTYTGEAIVEIKGIKAPVPFTFETVSQNPLKIKGNCEIPRKTFNIGKVKKRGGVSKMVKVEVEMILDSAF